MDHSLQAGQIIKVTELSTLSDGTAGGVEPGAMTFDICQQVIDQQVLVSEDEIIHAIRLMAKHEQFIIEGAAAVALAASLKCTDQWQGKRVGVILCGRNIDLDTCLSITSTD